MTQAMMVYNPGESFSQDIIDELEKPLVSSHIKERVGPGGTKLKYIKASTAIETANRVFGHGRWGYKIIARTLEESRNLDGTVTGLFYTCDLELSVAGAAFTFPGDGIGIVTVPKNGGSISPEAYEKARKEATSDALKRALRNYGSQFGLPLYDEDSYVEAADGQLVQVKELNKQNVAPSPRVVVDASPKTQPQAPQTAHRNGTSHNSSGEYQTVSRPSGEVTGANNGQSAKTVKAHFIQAYKISPENADAKWTSFKTHVLGSPIADEGLAPNELARLHGTIVQHEKSKQPA